VTASAGTVRQTNGTWTLVAPGPTKLGNADGPTAVDVVMTFARGTNRALAPLEVMKTVWIGEPSTNPDLPAITVAGAPPGDTITIPFDQDVDLSTKVPDGWRVNWLTSAGTLYEDDEPNSYIHVGDKDRRSGELACVVRDDQGGVAWKVWPIEAR
jgi:hypothetical protein